MYLLQDLDNSQDSVICRECHESLANFSSRKCESSGENNSAISNFSEGTNLFKIMPFVIKIPKSRHVDDLCKLFQKNRTSKENTSTNGVVRIRSQSNKSKKVLDFDSNNIRHELSNMNEKL